MFFVFTTTKNEEVVINSCHVVLVSDTKKGLFILCSDGNTFYVKESMEDFKNFSCCLNFN